MDNLARKLEEQTESRKKLYFHKCPACGCGDLIEFGVDTICCNCDWNSCKMYVDEGLMDDRLRAFKELFDPRNKIKIRREDPILKIKSPNRFKNTSDDSINSFNQAHNQFIKKVQGEL